MAQRSFSVIYADQRYDTSSVTSRSRFIQLREQALQRIQTVLDDDQHNVSLNRSDHSAQQTDRQMRFQQEIITPLAIDDRLWRRFEKRFLMQGDFLLNTLPITHELTPLQRLILGVALLETVVAHAQVEKDINSLNTVMRLVDFLLNNHEDDLILLNSDWLCRFKVIILCENRILKELGL